MEITVIDGLSVDTEFEVLGIVDVYESLVWTDRLDEAGSFELIVAPTIDMISLLQVNNCLSIPISTKWMVIEKIQIDTDVDLGSKMTVSGRSLEAMLSQRIIYESGGAESTGGSSTLEDCVDICFETCFEFPTAQFTRDVPFVEFVYSSDTRITAILQEGSWAPHENLYDIVTGLCRENGVGYKFEYVKSAGKIRLELILGQDRSYDQSTNPYVVFSPEFNNLLSSVYIFNNVPYKTMMYIMGPNEATPPYNTLLRDPGGWQQFTLREGILDGSTVPRYDDVGSPIEWNAYCALLGDLGRRSWHLFDPVNQFSGKASTTIVGLGVDHGVFKYGTDYFLGDIVQFENEFGVGGSCIITEVTISVSTVGFELYPTFVSVE